MQPDNLSVVEGDLIDAEELYERATDRRFRIGDGLAFSTGDSCDK